MSCGDRANRRGRREVKVTIGRKSEIEKEKEHVEDFSEEKTQVVERERVRVLCLSEAPNDWMKCVFLEGREQASWVKSGGPRSLIGG